MITFGTNEFTELGLTFTDMDVIMSIVGNEIDFDILENAVKEANGHFFVNETEYKGFNILRSIQKLYSVGIEDVTTAYEIILSNPTNPVDVVAGGSNLTYDEAVAMRKDIETMATLIPDEDAEMYVWAFPAWSGEGVGYLKDMRVSYNNLLYKCVQDHTSQPDWTPEAVPALWARIADPSIEWPEWMQPFGAHDAYLKGDKVSHNDKHWISLVDANVWEPSESVPTLWEEQE